MQQEERCNKTSEWYQFDGEMLYERWIGGKWQTVGKNEEDCTCERRRSRLTHRHHMHTSCNERVLSENVGVVAMEEGTLTGRSSASRRAVNEKCL